MVVTENIADAYLGYCSLDYKCILLDSQLSLNGMGYDFLSKTLAVLQNPEYNLYHMEGFALEYWVAMNETELKISLLLLEKMELPGVIGVEPDLALEAENLDGMLKKGFFTKSGDGTGWNPFVKMVLWTAANAQSELSVKGGTCILCRLYFYGETMILMAKDVDEDLFVFYYVPLLPKAIGGLAKCLEVLEPAMLSDMPSKSKTISLPPETADNSQLLKVLSAHAGPDQIDSELVPIAVDGWCFGEHSLERLLFKAEDGFWLARRDGEDLHLKSVGFYDFIQDISRWIVQTHGKSIAEKGVKTDG